MSERPPAGSFSRRTGWSRRPSRLAELLTQSSQSGKTLVDLTQSNPTRVALGDGERARWVAWLGDPAGVTYAPDARGRGDLREAIARYYGRRDREVDPDRILVAASSSEAYAWLFKLLGDPGDAVLAPEPSYPLFPFLAGLEDLRLVPYPLIKGEDWRIDLGALRRRIDEEPRARAILIVHPGNPTGSLLREDDARELAAIAREAHLALVIDEVFLDYPDPERPPSRRGSFAGFGEAHGVTCFVLSGLSKVALLPQVKLGWLLAEGPEAGEALARLELVADSYLSVSTAVQLAAPRVLDEVDALQGRLRARLERNLAALDEAIAAQGPTCPIRRLRRDGGWYAMIEVPRTRDDDGWVAHLIATESIVVHPGYFFDAAEDGLMVLSLLPEPEVFVPAVRRAVARFAAAE